MPSKSDILSRLVRKEDDSSGGADPWESLAATSPAHEREDSAQGDDKLNGLLKRINQLTGEESADGCSASKEGEREKEFVPGEPQSLHEVGLSESEVEALILKLMLSRGDLVGRDIAEHIRLPFVLIDELLRQMKQDQLVVYRSSASVNDYSVSVDRFGT